MKTYYFGHDRVYKGKRARGESGWDNPEQVQRNLDHIRSLAAAASLPQAPTALELGCGAGDIALRLAAEGWTVHGVDISPTAIDWAEEKARASGLHVGFHIADVCSDVALPIDPVDVVIDGHCLHCIIGRDRGAFFRFARRHLRPSGHLFVDTMCGEPCTPDGREHFDPSTRCLVYDDTAARYLGTPASILEEISRAGFAVLKSEVQEASDPDDQDCLLAVARRIPRTE